MRLITKGCLGNFKTERYLDKTLCTTWRPLSYSGNYRHDVHTDFVRLMARIPHPLSSPVLSNGHASVSVHPPKPVMGFSEFVTKIVEDVRTVNHPKYAHAMV